MTYCDFMNILDEQVAKTTGCAGHAAFRADVEALKTINNGFGLPAITANVWLHKICELSDADLCAYVERYRPGLLDARYEHYPFVGKPVPSEARR
ncbi:MAG: hypothetical protein IJA20_02225 [Methanocorpusculum sp.]|nr:hypothetical protein [Oscillospiraceae bacterium]MBQ3569469.1 hypothetical protein [Methanocorpusculum sp.]